jgi:LPXTG-motif cell wall-anchored protein
VIVATGTSISPKPITTQSGTVKPTATGTTILPQDTKSLPATGTPTTVLILLAAVSALALLLMRKRA